MGELKKEYRCVLDLAHDIIGGKWKLRILWNIQQGNNRFSMLERAIPNLHRQVLMPDVRRMHRWHLWHVTAKNVVCQNMHRLI